METRSPAIPGADPLAQALAITAADAREAGSLGQAVSLLERAIVAERRARELGGGYATRTDEAVDLLRSRLAGDRLPDAHAIGRWYERALDRSAGGRVRRRSMGAFYTPPAVIRHVLVECGPWSGTGGGPPTVLDPACGCGGFLIEAVRLLLGSGLGRDLALACIHGVDIDPLAARLTRLGLWLEAGDPEGSPDELVRRVVEGDSLALALQYDRGRAGKSWSGLFPGAMGEGGFGVVAGNPPFLSQLAAASARGRAERERLRGRFGGAVGAYTDPAGLFLLLASELTRRGGRFGLVLPVSTLAARDARGVREAVGGAGAMRSLWVDTEGAFDAGVRTCAPVFEKGGVADRVRVSAGNAPAEVGLVGGPVGPAGWGTAGAVAVGVPRVRVRRERLLGEIAEFRSGFRDEFYAVAPSVREEGDGSESGAMRVVTAGLIEPFACDWGSRACTIGGRRWARPVVGAVDGDGAADASALLRSLVEEQRRPKVLVATQTRVLEVCADPQGRHLAITPVIGAYPREGVSLWELGAVLASPVATLWIAGHSFGTARALGALKPSARELRACPAPVLREGIEAGAELFRRIVTEERARDERLVAEFGAAMGGAYGLVSSEADEILSWWLSRLFAGQGRRGRRERS